MNFPFLVSTPLMIVQSHLFIHGYLLDHSKLLPDTSEQSDVMGEGKRVKNYLSNNSSCLLYAFGCESLSKEEKRRKECHE